MAESETLTCTLCESPIVGHSDYVHFSSSCNHRAHAACFAYTVLQQRATCACRQSTTSTNPNNLVPHVTGLDGEVEKYVQRLRAAQQQNEQQRNSSIYGTVSSALGSMAKTAYRLQTSMTTPSTTIGNVPIDDHNVRSAVQANVPVDELLQRDFGLPTAARAALTVQTFFHSGYTVRDLHRLGYSEWASLVTFGFNFTQHVSPPSMRHGQVPIVDLVELYRITWNDLVQLPGFDMDLVVGFSLDELGALRFTFFDAVNGPASMQKQHVVQFSHIPLKQCVQQLGLTAELLYGTRLEWTLNTRGAWPRGDMEYWCPPPSLPVEAVPSAVQQRVPPRRHRGPRLY